MSYENVNKVAAQVAALCLAIKADAAGGVLPLVKADEVRDRISGSLFAIQQIGETLDALGGQPLVNTIILAVEEMMDDVNAGVFLSRRWDGFPRPGPRLSAIDEDEEPSDEPEV